MLAMGFKKIGETYVEMSPKKLPRLSKTATTVRPLPKNPMPDIFRPEAGVMIFTN